jgi:hypothetical protein
MGRRLGPGLLASVVLASSMVLVPSSAAAFGTVEGGGQHREHERITRAAVACPAGTGSDGDCFEPRSVDQLAGTGKRFGAVGAPDLTETSDPAAHCDDADVVAGSYPQTRDEATARLGECVDHLQGRFREAIDSAKGLLDGNGQIVGPEVDLGTECVFGAATEQRAKCATLEAFGRALHGAQDFYSHSNWADEADPGRPIDADNPPGLNLPAPSPVLDLRGSGTPTVPRDLTTGCFVVPDTVPGVKACQLRVTHAALNKDTGLIDPITGTTSDPTTPRGKVGNNFAKAVAGAMVETRHQWQDLRDALEARYGSAAASLMACTLTHDDPLNDCPERSRAGLALAISGLLVIVLGAGILMVLVRHRRRGNGTSRSSAGRQH